MARTRIWLSWLPLGADEAAVQARVQGLQRSGLEVQGSGWNRDLTSVGWTETATPLVERDDVALWLIVGNAADLADPAVRYGLSLAAATIKAKRARPLAVAVAGLDGPLTAGALPPLLRDAACLSPPANTWGPQVIAAALRRRASQLPEGFRLSVIAHPSLGQWFEVGPGPGACWQGALFGVDGAEITHQGVGQAGALPERCTLEYPSRGIQVTLAAVQFSCWGVRNRLADDESLFVRIVGAPHRIVFGEFPEQDEADLHMLALV